MLEILIFTIKNSTKLLILRYLGIYNVLHIWHIWAIPTYRVYYLYDNEFVGKLDVPTMYCENSELVVFYLYSIGFCKELIQTSSQKLDILKSILTFTSILITFIRPSLKHSQRQSVSCGGICDFSFSAGLLLYAIFFTLKMIYPIMNLIYWLISAGTAHTVHIKFIISVLLSTTLQKTITGENVHKVHSFRAICRKFGQATPTHDRF